MSLLLKTAIETLPAGASNPRGIMQGNWSQVEKLLDPDHANHTNTGKNYDVANAVRDRVLGGGWKELVTTSPITLNYDMEAVQYARLASNKTINFTNHRHGKFVHCLFDTTGAVVNLTWPANSVIVWTTGATNPIYDDGDTADRVELVTIIPDGTHWTVTTLTAHGLGVAELVRMRPFMPPNWDAFNGEPGDTEPTPFNGVYEVAIVDSPTVFRIANTELPTASPGGPANWLANADFDEADYVYYNGNRPYLNKVTLTTGTAPTAPTTIGPLWYTITSITNDGVNWTFTTSTPHLMKTGQTIAVQGCSVSGYNTSETVTEVVSPTVFRCANTSTPASATDGSVYRTPSPFTYIKLWVLGGAASLWLVLAEVHQQDR